MIHFLKVLPKYFEAIVTCRKSFEVRKKDRNYKIGDLIAFNEFDPDGSGYTGRSFIVHITYILDDDRYSKDGYVILSIASCIIHALPFVLSENVLNFDCGENCTSCPIYKHLPQDLPEVRFIRGEI